MAPSPPRPRLLTFGVFELDALTGELRREGRLVRLRHQPATVLRLLLERAGDLLTRRELTEALWSDDVDVDVEQGLNHCMKEIRSALGDRPDSPRFIQTLPRRGYRFLLEVRTDGREPRAILDPPPPSKTALPDPDADPGLIDGRFE
jgi:DNA-binding winged helix-turn-helix (wHTH) protein